MCLKLHYASASVAINRQQTDILFIYQTLHVSLYRLCYISDNPHKFKFKYYIWTDTNDKRTCWQRHNSICKRLYICWRTEGQMRLTFRPSLFECDAQVSCCVAWLSYVCWRALKCKTVIDVVCTLNWIDKWITCWTNINGRITQTKELL